MSPRSESRLADETSPYLRQHADNPVDWYPWGEEALERARREDRPIFLSVGYSACHWCHVMEEESFENDEIAGLLNDYFVNVKVDREERPDVDGIYMDAVQMLSGQGGWPMSVWLTPQLEPFYAGTYFPPHTKWGRPGFRDVIEEVHRVWTEERGRIDEIADAITERLEALADPTEAGQLPGREVVRIAADGLSRKFDPHHGGFGRAPKFPPSAQCRLLMRISQGDDFSEQQRQRARKMIDHTLVQMACGGMYDQLGGGFHRYSTDEKWLIPHFEKMLYDNALLMTAYREGWQLTGRPLFRRIVDEIGDYVLRQMHDAGETGAFYSTQDADTEGEEGKFFVWTPDELREVLGDEDGRRAAQFWGVVDQGNFEDGTSALHRLEAVDVEAGRFPKGELPNDFEKMRRRLLEARNRRVKPATDDKIIASWNGLMIEALAKAGFALQRHDFIDAAQQAADFVLDEMCNGARATDLHRIHSRGRTRYAGCLSDYANMALAAVALYEATSSPRWLDDAQQLVDEMMERFQSDSGALFYAQDDHGDLLVRQVEVHDRATPSASSRALEAMQRLALWTGDESLHEQVERGLAAYADALTKHPEAMTNMLRVFDVHQEGPRQVVCARGQEEGGETLQKRLRRAYLRDAGMVVVDDADRDDAQPAVVRDKSTVHGQTTVYVCERGVCRQPVTEAEELPF